MVSITSTPLWPSANIWPVSYTHLPRWQFQFCQNSHIIDCLVGNHICHFFLHSCVSRIYRLVNIIFLFRLFSLFSSMVPACPDLWGTGLFPGRWSPPAVSWWAVPAQSPIHRAEAFHIGKSSDNVPFPPRSFPGSSSYPEAFGNHESAVRLWLDVYKRQDIECIVFVRGKQPDENMKSMAKERNLTLMVSDYRMFTACGKLYEQGMRGGDVRGR